MPFYQYDSEEHRERADAVLTRLGKFVVAFERISAGMRSCICCAFTREGLKNQGLCQALINGKAAAGVREALGSIFTELRDQDEADRACVKNLLGRIASLAEKRNTLLHAEWHLNYDYEGATDDFLAFAMKLGSSQSTVPNSKEWTSTSLGSRSLSARRWKYRFSWTGLEHA